MGFVQRCSILPDEKRVEPAVRLILDIFLQADERAFKSPSDACRVMAIALRRMNSCSIALNHKTHSQGHSCLLCLWV